MGEAGRDNNSVPTLLALSSVDGVTPVAVYADPVTHRLLVDTSAGGASQALDNLASVAINTSLISDTDNTDDLGSAAKEWKDIYIDGVGYIDTLQTDVIQEDTLGNGVTIDGLLIKDSGIGGATATELGYCSGVSSAIQTQLDAKGTLSNVVEDTTPQLGGNLDAQDNSITGIDTLAFTDTAGTIAGIQNQNLLDKSAAETVSGAWTYSDKLTLGKDSTNNDDTAIALETSADEHVKWRLGTTSTAGHQVGLEFKSKNATNDRNLGNLVFIGDDSIAAATEYAKIYATQADVTNATEDGSIFLNTMVAGTATDVVSIVGGNIGIGTSSPITNLHIESAANTETWSPTAGTTAVFEGTNTNITLLTNNTGNTRILFADLGNQNAGTLGYNNNTDYMWFETADVERMRIDSDGGIFMNNLLAAAASTDVNINGSNELHSVTSSIRFKENITDLKQDTSAIYDLKVKEYDFKKEFGGNHEVGIIAEEAIKHTPQLVVKDKEGKPYSFQYSRLSVFLLAEIQKLLLQVVHINNRIKTLETAK